MLSEGMGQGLTTLPAPQQLSRQQVPALGFGKLNSHLMRNRVEGSLLNRRESTGSIGPQALCRTEHVVQEDMDKPHGFKNPSQIHSR